MSQESFQDMIGRLLSQVCRLKHTRMHTLCGEIGLYRGQPFVLRLLWENEGVTQSELAERLHVQPATVTNTLKRMEKAGLVERRQDVADQRVSRVYLTDAGREIQDAIVKAWQEIDEQTFAGLSAGERDMLRQLLVRVRENLLHEI